MVSLFPAFFFLLFSFPSIELFPSLSLILVEFCWFNSVILM